MNERHLEEATSFSHFPPVFSPGDIRAKVNLSKIVINGLVRTDRFASPAKWYPPAFTPRPKQAGILNKNKRSKLLQKSKSQIFRQVQHSITQPPLLLLIEAV
ncbi:MAG TPA: hypothetical protein PKY82_08130 [Pyrinomonadaceae bacterium]|nr:hypothetical protein [Pyrinomonadaceae bacterium]